MQKAEPKKNWTITSAAFQRLLGWLDEGRSSEGQSYLSMRRKLISYFDRKNCPSPEDLADETLNRVARRLEEEAGEITGESPAKYCYIVARFVFMEHLRGADKSSVSLDEAMQNAKSARHLVSQSVDEEREAREKTLECLDRCIGRLDSASREIIVNYYFGKERVKIENRRALAERLGISANALTIRACRIRDKLEGCVGKCVEET